MKTGTIWKTKILRKRRQIPKKTAGTRKTAIIQNDSKKEPTYFQKTTPQENSVKFWEHTIITLENFKFYVRKQWIMKKKNNLHDNFFENDIKMENGIKLVNDVKLQSYKTCYQNW